MKSTLVTICAASALVLAGCGDDDGGGSDLSEAQQGAVDQAMAQGDEIGTEIDRGCVEELAADLTEDDAQAIVDAGPDGDPDLSAEGDALQARLLECIDDDAIIDLFISSIEDAGQEVDNQCVKDALEGVDLAPLLAQEGDEPPAEIVEAVLGCVEL